MKATPRFAVAALTLAALLGAAASSAQTSIADRPLKASLLAKPNIVFAMDDSGSMDWEVLLDTVQGQVWWNTTTAWNTTGNKPLSETNASGEVSYSYLFPGPKASTYNGGHVTAYNANYGYILPPTAEFAWLRSAKFNPLYYDSKTTYKPWSPAYLDGATKTYGNATPGAAKLHPAYATSPTLKLDADWTTTATDSSLDSQKFYFAKGTTLPSNAIRISGNSTCSAGNKVTSTNCYAIAPFYPATFWAPDNCTIGANCVLAPDGTTKLKRYEIKSATWTTSSYPASGRNYADEMQNFANWFTYYRKRKLMLAASMGKVMEDMTGARLAVAPFNNLPASLSMKDADAPLAANNRLAIAGAFYKNADSLVSTPTHAAVKFIGGQFDTNTNIVQYACQRNSMFVVTDGLASNASLSGVPAYTASLYKSNVAPYTTTSSGSLADWALSYYTNRLRASGGSALAAGKVPPSTSTSPNADKNTNLHVNTYAVSLGVRGSLWPNTVDPFVTAPTWPTPAAADPSLLDDQWHATINGRGLMFLATNPTETTKAIQDGLNDIMSQTGAQGGIAVSTVNLPRGDTKAYFGTYNPAGWAGDLTANSINAATGAVNTTASWKAGALLLARDWTNRIIATSSGSSANSAAVDFNVTNVASVVNPGAVYGSDTAVIDYLRGDRSGEGTLFRARTGLLGAIIGSEPVLSREDAVVYVASGEGMLHAFDTSAANPGKELWAFVPKQVLPTLGETVERGYSFGTKLDGTPVLGNYSSTGKILVAGMGVAGRGYYALDVSSPRVSSASQLTVKWEFPSAADADKVGQTLGRPVIVKTESNGYVVLVTSGYNNAANGPGRLWMLNADTGAVLKTFTTTGSTDSGLAHVAAFAEPPTGTVRYAYGGDLLGKVWRFDLSDASATPTPKLVASLTGPTGAAQPITATPELLWHKETSQRVIMVGTGRLLDIGDFTNTNVQSIYAIADDATLLPLATPRTTLAKQTYVRGATPDKDTLTGPDVNWSTNRGWFIDLPAKEQINTRPTIAYGGLAFVSNSNSGSDCDASSYLYVVDVLSGKKFNGSDFIASLLSDKSNSSGVTALLTTSQKIVGAMQDGDGNPVTRNITGGSPINPSKNSWVEVRR